jgi:excisionase family DNA binding protein
MENKEIWTIDEAAEFLRVSVATVRNYITKGWLQALRNPDGTGPMRFKAEDVRNFFASPRPDGLTG